MKNVSFVKTGNPEFQKSKTFNSRKKVLKNHQKMPCQHALYSIGKFSHFREHRSARSRARKNHVDNVKFYNDQTFANF